MTTLEKVLPCAVCDETDCDSPVCLLLVAGKKESADRDTEIAALKARVVELENAHDWALKRDRMVDLDIRDLLAERDAIQARTISLCEALRDHRCPVDNSMLVGMCVDEGKCGCTNGLLLPKPSETGSE